MQKGVEGINHWIKRLPEVVFCQESRHKNLRHKKTKLLPHFVWSSVRNNQSTISNTKWRTNETFPNHFVTSSLILVG